MNMKKEMMCLLFGMSLSLVIILLHDNVQPHVARMPLQKLIDLGYKTLPHLPYSPDLSPTNNHSVKYLVDPHTWMCKSGTTSTNLHTAAM